jgi:xanthine dehydrogenase accessory factor
MDLLIEVVNRGPSLYLFGAGHVGQALCRTLQGTPFQVQVIDERAEWVNSSEIPQAVRRHHCEWDEFVSDAAWDPQRTFVAIMTHRHDTDQDIIQKVVTQPARYIGLIGSEAKWTRFRSRLLDRGSREEDLAKVRSPIGLDIGGKSPQEVAISVASELLKVHYDK